MTRREMLRRGGLGAAAGAALLSGGVGAAAGQETAPPVRTLADVLDRIDWDPAERGALLIVAPERARRAQPAREEPGGGFTRPPLPPLKAPGPSGYRLTAIDAEFGRKLTQAGGLWSLVPTTMAVLRYKDLPEPDPYESLTADEKERLLYSLLTPAQWRRLGSPEGLGAGDLDRTQRALFAAMLPQPFRVQVTAPGEPQRVVELTPEQAAGTRLTLRRTLDWSFTKEGKPTDTVSVGVGGAQRTDGRPTLRVLRDVPPRVRFSPFGEDDQAAEPVPVFGVPIREAVPNRPKPGDLNFEATALARAVPLAGAATVGDLVKRVAEASGLELYADPRYAGLAIHVRGESARAADVLQALCLSVTGTFRKVEDGADAKAWVLTDDLQGLAVRHGSIRRWARATVARNNAYLAEVADRLRAAQPEQYVGWAEDDPSGVTPDGALRQKIDTYLQKLRTPAAAPPTAEPRDAQAVLRREQDRQLLVPVQELPPAARELVTKQIESWGRIGATGAGQAAPRLREDVVRIDVQLTPAWIIPGVGTADAGRNMSGGWTSLVSTARADADRLRADATRARADEDARRAATPLPAALPASGDRGLMVSPESPEEAAKAAAEAARLGMTHLWLSVAPGESPETVAAWAKAARATAPRLGLFAEVRALRLPKADPASTGGAAPEPDRNLFGETLTECAARIGKEPDPRPVVSSGGTYASRHAARLERAAAPGDFARVDTEGARSALVRRVAAIAAVPEIDGVALRDLEAPGYRRPEKNVFRTGLDEPGESDLGYTAEMRLRFLRRTGCDPIDLLRDGDRGTFNGIRMSAGGGWREMPGLGLPFFQDRGRNWASGRVVNGRTAQESSDAMPASFFGWGTFRADVNAEYQKNLHRALTAARPAGAPLRLLRGGEEFTRHYVPWEGANGPGGAPAEMGGGASPKRVQWIGSPDSSSPGSPPDAAEIDRYARNVVWWLRADDLLPPPPAGGGTATAVAASNRGRAAGFVLDLSGRPWATAAALLSRFTPPPR